ncbi:dTMP kinase [Streptomyces sp. NPDC101455]|uniref:dTMP kinase n=1 Tax=Streptomyces sp. NPDC101455 TaxID=3366142 RepID=UPI00380699A7
MTNRFPFIVIEGLDGSGKTTLRKGLFRLFEHLYGATPLAVLTTNWLDPDVAADLAEGKYAPTSANRDRYLDALKADKRATVEQLILPSLGRRPVIADRWLISELAFFAVKHDQPPQVTYAGLSEAIGLVPDLTLVLETSTDTSMVRAASRPGDAVRDDWDVTDVQTRVRAVYQAVTAVPDTYGKIGPIVRIDAGRSRAEVLFDAWTALLDHALTPAPAGSHA